MEPNGIIIKSLLVDDFNEYGTPDFIEGILGYEQAVYLNTTGGLTNTETGLDESSVIGGSRRLDIAGNDINGTTMATIGSASNAGVISGLTIGDGSFLMGNQGGVNSIGTVTYDANGSGLNLDIWNDETLTLDFNVFEFDVISNDHSFQLNVEFQSNLEGGTPNSVEITYDFILGLPDGNGGFESEIEGLEFNNPHSARQNV